MCQVKYCLVELQMQYNSKNTAPILSREAEWLNQRRAQRVTG